MNNLRKASKMALEALDAYSWEQVDAARTALRQALAQPEQEPVAWMIEIGDVTCFDFRPHKKHKSTPLYTAPPSIEAAVLVEREECAKLCDEWNTAITDKLAAEIRSRNEQKISV